MSGAGGRDEYLYQQQKVEEESGSHGNNNNNNNASGNGGGGGGIKHAPSLAQIFGTANAAGNNFLRRRDGAIEQSVVVAAAQANAPGVHDEQEQRATQ